MKLEKKFYRLINEYHEIKDELLNYEDSLHDGMYWDIQGYIETFENELENQDEIEAEIEQLEKQVSACRMILDGFKSLKYVYC